MTRLEQHRRAYLEAGLSFDEIVHEVRATLVVTCVVSKPYKSPGREDPKAARKARQCIFEIGCSSMSCDLLFNAPDGLRGRYWQAPARGEAANRLLIDQMIPALVAYLTGAHSQPMQTRDIRRSLDAPSAKVWPREQDTACNSLLVEHPLVVPRWAANCQADCRAPMWRKTPVGGWLHVKGALIGQSGEEYVPAGKKDRSRDIHRYGFT